MAHPDQRPLTPADVAAQAEKMQARRDEARSRLEAVMSIDEFQAADMVPFWRAIAQYTKIHRYDMAETGTMLRGVGIQPTPDLIKALDYASYIGQRYMTEPKPQPLKGSSGPLARNNQDIMQEDATQFIRKGLEVLITQQGQGRSIRDVVHELDPHSGLRPSEDSKSRRGRPRRVRPQQ